MNRIVIALVLVAAWAGAPSVGVAQPEGGADAPATPGQPAERADAAELNETLMRLRAELRDEQAAADEAAATREQEVEALRAQRDALADELLSSEMDRRAERDTLASLEAERAQAEERVTALGDAVEQVRDAAIRYAEGAGVALSELPAHDAALEQLRTWQTQLTEADTSRQAQADPAQTAAPLVGLLALADRLHEGAHAVTTRRTEVWTARGERESVDLLAAGQVLFAYRTVDDGRIGMAVASPDDASGYRWSEALAEATADRFSRAIERLRAGERSAIPPLPTDVTGRLNAAALQEDGSALAPLLAGGVVMIPLAVVAGLALVLIAERAWVLYVRNGRAQGAVQRILATSARGEYDAAERAASTGRGAVARTLAACLRRRGKGQHAMEDSIQEQLLHELPRLNRFLGGIAILAAVAPLLGLLGTVTGIIETFGVIRSFGNAEPGLMAGGISEALVTTATGLSIAIPVLLIHSLLRGRVDRIIADAEKQAATLLNTITHADRPADKAASQSETPAATATVEAGS